MQSDVTILFIDDHAGVRDGIGCLLSQKHERFSFLYAETAQEGAEALLAHPHIALAIVDLNLAGEDGLTAVADLRSVRPTLPVIIYTMYADPHHIETALKADVQGYITKNTKIDELENAIFTVLNGGNCYTKAASAIMQSLIGGKPPAEESDAVTLLFANYKSLSKTEQEVFALLAQKKEPDQIARILGKKEKTVVNQRSIIYQKLNFRDRLDLIEFAKTIGVIV